MIDLQKHIIDEFGSEIVQKRYFQTAEKGLWESEEILIKEFFKPDSTILDIGCGTGRTTIPLHKMGYKVVGIDLVPAMIKNAKKIANKKKLDISYVIGDATDLKFKDNSFNGALFSNNGWTQIPGKQKRQKALSEVYRILKPGRYYIFTAHCRRVRDFLFWLKQWIKLFILKPLGFKIAEIDFGDRFFKREIEGKKIKQKQFIHIASIKEVKKQINRAGFELIYVAGIDEISKDDVDSRRGSLGKNDKNNKSPVFYVCQK